LQLGISIGAAVFPHDGNTYETLLATADSRMYRDKTRRKRQNAKSAPHVVSSRREALPEISDSELEQAASGVL
jgi:predicted signal transduction protein with EAL and GGDEF domain